MQIIKNLIPLWLFLFQTQFICANDKIWTLGKLEFEIEKIDNGPLYSINCYRQKTECLARKKMINSSKSDLPTFKEKYGGKNPMHLTCHKVGGRIIKLYNKQDSKLFCIFQDNSLVDIDSLYIEIVSK